MPNTAAVHSVRESFDEAIHLAFERPGEALPELHLVEPLLERAADEGPLANHTEADTRALLYVARWAKEFLTQPHPELGRSGHVCPYVSASIREQRFLLTALHDAATNRRQVERTILRLGRYFSKVQQPTHGRAAHKKTIVIVFPDLPDEQAAEIINGMHQRLKPHFLRAGMMLGEFYRDSHKPGLHNPEFRPLRSDVPLLVIRAMLPGDIAFLSDRPRFVRAFLRNFGARGCAEIRSYLERQGGAVSATERLMLLTRVAEYESHGQSGARPRAVDAAAPALDAVRASAREAGPSPRARA
jgi:hypothetical protein